MKEILISKKGGEAERKKTSFYEFKAECLKED